MASRSVFISYARTDRDDVNDAVDLLRAGGVKVFLDVVNIDFGERWKDMLYKALYRCERVMVFWSQAAAASEWVEREWRYALELGKKIVPTLLDFTPLPAELAKFQAVKRLRPAKPTRRPRATRAEASPDELDSTGSFHVHGPHDHELEHAAPREHASPLWRVARPLVAITALAGALGAGGYFVWRAPHATPPVSIPGGINPAASAPQPGQSSNPPDTAASVALPASVPAWPASQAQPGPIDPAQKPTVPVILQDQLVSPSWPIFAAIAVLASLVAWLVRRVRRRSRHEASAFVEQVFAA